MSVFEEKLLNHIWRRGGRNPPTRLSSDEVSVFLTFWVGWVLASTLCNMGGVKLQHFNSVLHSHRPPLPVFASQSITFGKRFAKPSQLFFNLPCGLFPSCWGAWELTVLANWLKLLSSCELDLFSFLSYWNQQSHPFVVLRYTPMKTLVIYCSSIAVSFLWMTKINKNWIPNMLCRYLVCGVSWS